MADLESRLARVEHLLAILPATQWLDAEDDARAIKREMSEAGHARREAREAAVDPKRDGRCASALGSHDVRTYCLAHRTATMSRFEWLARCDECGEDVALCCATFGTKECVREIDHEGVHVSRSGSSWPDGASEQSARQARARATQEGVEQFARREAALADDERARAETIATQRVKIAELDRLVDELRDYAEVVAKECVALRKRVAGVEHDRDAMAACLRSLGQVTPLVGANTATITGGFAIALGLKPAARATVAELLPEAPMPGDCRACGTPTEDGTCPQCALEESPPLPPRDPADICARCFSPSGGAKYCERCATNLGAGAR